MKKIVYRKNDKIGIMNRKKHHRPDAVKPSKNARCPPCCVVARTMFLFALQ